MSRKFYILIQLLLVGSIFSGCNNTIVDEESEGYYPIEFEAIIDPQFTSSSRGVRLSSTNLSSFGVWGFNNNTARVRNIVFTKTNGTWRGSRTITWASGAMEFYAFSPSFSVSSGNSNSTMLQSPKYVE